MLRSSHTVFRSSRFVAQRCHLLVVGLFALVFTASELPAFQAESITKEAQTAIDAGLKFLSERQNENGSFGDGAKAENVGVVSLIGIAFLAEGSLPGKGKYGSHLRKITTFVMSHCQENGFITNPTAKTHGPMYGHGFATLFLAEAYGAFPDANLRKQLAKATKLIVDTQNVDGGWRYQPERNEADISVTICQVMALRAAKNAGIYVPNKTIEKCIDYVKKSQNGDGGFRYQLTEGSPISAFPRTAAGIVALFSAGIYKGKEIDVGLTYISKNRPDIRLDESHYFYGHYYAVQAMWHAGGKFWSDWYPAVRDEMIKSQDNKTGAWKDQVSSEYGTAMACIILQIPNNTLPIFQR